LGAAAAGCDTEFLRRPRPPSLGCSKSSPSVLGLQRLGATEVGPNACLCRIGRAPPRRVAATPPCCSAGLEALHSLPCTVPSCSSASAWKPGPHLQPQQVRQLGLTLQIICSLCSLVVLPFSPSRRTWTRSFAVSPSCRLALGCTGLRPPHAWRTLLMAGSNFIRK
jgi:hypothetical protein